MTRFISGIGLLALFAVSLLGCERKNPNNSAQPSGRILTIGFVVPLVSHPAWMVVKKGAEDAGKKHGFEVIWAGADDSTLPRMLEAMETFIAQRVDGIAVYPISPPAFTPVLKKAKQSGIPVATYCADAEHQDLRAGFAGSDMVAIGQVQIHEAHKKLGKDKMLIGVLMGNLDAANQMIQVKEFEAYIRNIEGARIVDKRENGGGGDDAKTLDVVSSMLRAHPEINVILETDGGGPSMVGKVLAEMNLTDKVVAIGMDDLPQSLDAVRQGLIDGLMVQNFYRWGYEPARNAYLAAKKEKVQNFTDTGFVFVNKDNVDTYKAIFYRAL